MTAHQDPVPLAAVLRGAAAELAAQSPPAELQARLLALADSATRPTARAQERAGQRHWGLGSLGLGTLLAAACLVFSLVLALKPAPTEAEAGFLALVPTERWPAGDSTAWVVKTELSGERLAALGLPYDPARAGERIPAELLLHASGEVLAVRFAP